MAREPFEFTLDRGDRFERVLFTPSTYEPDNPPPHYRKQPARMRLEYDPEWALIEIADEDVTSEKPEAQAVGNGRQITHEITTDEARWLYRHLGELLARLDGAQVTRPMTPDRLAEIEARANAMKSALASSDPAMDGVADIHAAQLAALDVPDLISAIRDRDARIARLEAALRDIQASAESLMSMANEGMALGIGAIALRATAALAGAKEPR